MHIINIGIVIGNALVSVQVGSKLALSTSQWLLACTPVLPTWISMLYVCTYIYWIAHRTEGRDIHRGTCGLYLFVTQYIVYPIKRVRLNFLFCVPQGHFMVLQFEPRCQRQEKSTSLKSCFLISFHWRESCWRSVSLKRTCFV